MTAGVRRRRSAVVDAANGSGSRLLAGSAGLRSMPPASAAGRRDEGRAIVEFVFVGVLLLVPLVYLVLTLGRIQAAAFSVTNAAREAGRAFTTAPVEQDASARADAAAALAFADFGFTEDARAEVTCDGVPCLRPNGRVTATASVDVALPLVPAFLSGAVPLSVPVSSTSVAVVDRFGPRASAASDPASAR